MSNCPPIVLDQGTGFVKVGYAGSNFPEQQYPSIVGRPILRAEERSGDVEIKDIMVGEEAAQVRSMLQISYPVIDLDMGTLHSHTELTLEDGEWNNQKLGRHDTSLGLHFLRGTQDRSERPEDSPYRTSHESYFESATYV